MVEGRVGKTVLSRHVDHIYPVVLASASSTCIPEAAVYSQANKAEVGLRRNQVIMAKLR